MGLMKMNVICGITVILLSYYTFANKVKFVKENDSFKDIEAKLEDSDLFEHNDEDITLAAQCKMQCFCEKCASSSTKLSQTCREMPYAKDPSCDCHIMDSIECPADEDIQKMHEKDEALCKLSCFCRDCKDDKRMKGVVKQACSQTQILPPGCDCVDHETANCGEFMDTLAGVADQMKLRRQEL